MALNGRLTSAQLTAVSGTYLSKTAAQAWKNMVYACKKATGITLTITLPYGGYRNLSAQAYLHAHPQGPVAVAAPGYSTHGLGDAVDINNAWQVAAWLNANASKFGFTKTFSSESWHYHHAGTVGPYPPVPSGPNKPVSGPERLHPGESLRAGDFICSPDGKWRAIVQSDNNFLFQKLVTGNWKVVWHDHGNKGDKGSAWVTMQAGGILSHYVMVKGRPKLLWQSGTNGHPHAFLQAAPGLLTIREANGVFLKDLYGKHPRQH